MTGIVTTPGSWRNHWVGHAKDISEGKWKQYGEWAQWSGLLALAYCYLQSQTVTWPLTCLTHARARTHAHTNIKYESCYMPEPWDLVPQFRSAAPQFTAPSGHTVQHTVTELLRVTFGQELRHPHIVMFSRAFETCFPTSDSFYMEVNDTNFREATGSSQLMLKTSDHVSWMSPHLHIEPIIYGV